MRNHPASGEVEAFGPVSNAATSWRLLCTCDPRSQAVPEKGTAATTRALKEGTVGHFWAIAGDHEAHRPREANRGPARPDAPLPFRADAYVADIDMGQQA